MPERNPLSATEVLSEEFSALRPDTVPESTGEPATHAQAHRDADGLSALCISGGGIRSATFALGAIQGLAEHGLLDKFDYLSTVSGGGYIGSWLTAWKHRVGGIEKVVPRLRRDAPRPDPGETNPIQHLREYNSYLSPSRGAFSTDLWTMIATVLRNVLLNWMVLIPALAFVLILPRLYLSSLSFPELFYGDVIFAKNPPDYGAAVLDRIGEAFVVDRVIPLLSLVLFATALFNTLRFLPGVGGREHSVLDYALKVLAPLVGAVLGFLLFDSLYYLGVDYVEHTNLTSVVLWTTIPCLLAWLAFLLTQRRHLGDRLGMVLGRLSLAVAAMAIGTGTATWVATNYLLWDPNPEAAISWAGYVTVGPPMILFGYCLGTVLFVGLSSGFLKDEDREWMSRSVAGVLLFVFAWTVICSMVLVLPELALGWRRWAQGALGVATAAAAWLSSMRGSSAANANPGASAPEASGGPLVWVKTLAPAIFIALLAGAISVGTNMLLELAHNVTRGLIEAYGAVPRCIAGMTLAEPNGGAVVTWHNHYGMLTRSQPVLVIAVALLFAVVSWVMSRYVNINTFSLHGMYRDRLVRAYLGASNPDRRASRFTGFSRGDDMPIAELDPGQRPLHVINLTLNLVSGKRLSWQERKAASFTVSPQHTGSADLAYRPSAQYAGAISLGTAMALSGAAASPNMGSFSSPMVGFIMTLFNARLGSWLGNPGPTGRRTWTQPGPRSAIASLAREALGQTSDESEYVYLSDGGHFDNLGLYEMVRRRCRTIVVLDGGADPECTFDSLGNALRKIRIDFGITIEFEAGHLQQMREHKQRCGVATIRYAEADGEHARDGRLIYVRPELLGDEPADVLSYAAANKNFPHQSTADQWFDESQTESYRMLGLATIDAVCAEWDEGTMADFCRHVEGKYPAQHATATDAA